MARNYEHAIEYSNKWIGIINKTTVPEEEGKWIIEESKNNFAEHFNRGWPDLFAGLADRVAGKLGGKRVLRERGAVDGSGGGQQGGNGRAMGFGKSRAKLLTQETNRVTFEDVAGVDEAKEELQEIVEFLRDPQKFQRLPFISLRQFRRR